MESWWAYYKCEGYVVWNSDNWVGKVCVFSSVVVVEVFGRWRWKMEKGVMEKMIEEMNLMMMWWWLWWVWPKDKDREEKGHVWWKGFEWMALYIGNSFVGAIVPSSSFSCYHLQTRNCVQLPSSHFPFSFIFLFTKPTKWMELIQLFINATQISHQMNSS